MRFEDELSVLLPRDLPHRERVIELSALHLALILETNQHMNLTRITDGREACIKHVLDSVLPWRHFTHARSVLDAGTGAGFPGVPLALALPNITFTLVESIGKKARFVESVVERLALANADVIAERAEDVLRHRPAAVITTRAFAPLNRTLRLFAPALKRGARALLYKGPDVDAEIAETMADAQREKIAVRMLERYALPDACGMRTLVELTSA